MWSYVDCCIFNMIIFWNAILLCIHLYRHMCMQAMQCMGDSCSLTVVGYSRLLLITHYRGPQKVLFSSSRLGTSFKLENIFVPTNACMACRFHIKFYSLHRRYLQLKCTSPNQLQISPNRPNCRYLQLNWRYLQFNCGYLQFNCRYLQIGWFADIYNSVNKCENVTPSANQLEISPIELEISPIELEISPNTAYLEISPIELQIYPIEFGDISKYADLEISAIHLEISPLQLKISPIQLEINK